MHSGRLIIVRGLPGCGKSTWAKAQVALAPLTTARINKDDFRMMIHDGLWLQAKNPGPYNNTERIVNAARDGAIANLLQLGYTVISDDTNLSHWVVEELRSVAEESNSSVEIEDMREVPLQICLDRNRLREGKARVPDEVIIGMHSKYIAGTNA